MIPQLLRQLSEHTLHLAILFSNNLHDLLDLRIDVVAQLPNPIRRLSRRLPYTRRQFLTRGRERFFEVVDIVDDLMRDIACEFFEVELCAQSYLYLGLDHVCEFIDQVVLVVFVEVVLLTHVLLQPLYLAAVGGLLLLSLARLELDLVHHVSELVLDCLV